MESGRDRGALVYLFRLTGRCGVVHQAISMDRCEQAGGARSARQVAREPPGRGARSARTPPSQDTARGCREGVGAGGAGGAGSQATQGSRRTKTYVQVGAAGVETLQGAGHSLRSLALRALGTWEGPGHADTEKCLKETRRCRRLGGSSAAAGRQARAWVPSPRGRWACEEAHGHLLPDLSWSC